MEQISPYKLERIVRHYKATPVRMVGIDPRKSPLYLYRKFLNCYLYNGFLYFIEFKVDKWGLGRYSYKKTPVDDENVMFYIDKSKAVI